MADEATLTVDSPVEATDPIVEAVVDSPVESDAPTDDVVQEPETVEGAVEQSPTFSLADLSDDDLLNHLRERKDGSGLSLEERLRKSERDRERERIRREQGSVDRAQQYHAWLTEQLEAGKSAEEIAKQTPTFVKANQDFLTTELAKAWVEAALPLYGVPEQEVIASVLEGFVENGDVNGLGELAKKTWDAAHAKAKQSAVYDIKTLDEIPADAPLRAALREHVQSEVEKELKAREVEQVETPENPPRTPQGSVPAGIERYLNMGAREAASLPEAEYREWQRAQSGAAS